MKVFGPFYPTLLQGAVNHAELFCALLVGYEVKLPSRDEEFLAWLSGRDGEVTRVVEGVIADWKTGSVSADRATLQIDRYLRGLHEALVHLHVVTEESGLPSCCVSSLNTTVSTSPLTITTTADATPLTDVEPARSGTVVQSIEGALLDDLLKDTGAR